VKSKVVIFGGFEVIQSILNEKSLEFAAQTVKFCVKLNERTKENIITKQLIRSSTSIGANINEANYGVSRASYQKCKYQ